MISFTKTQTWSITATILFNFFTLASLEASFITLPQLAQSKEWTRLLHYRSSLFGIRSEADNPRFFFSAEGKTNPLKEIEATFKALTEPQFTGTDSNQHPHCRFPARMQWLKKVTGFKRPLAKCSDYETWIESLKPESLALIYAGNYPNNPASIFGHTFLKVISKRDAFVQLPSQGSQKLELLDYAIGFAASAGEHFYLDFYLKGIFGGYEGHFDLAPYYLKVNEYNNAESRDLWEYTLDFNAEETRFLLSHLWEIGSNTHFDYYFFDENCSYHVLGLIEVAKPQWDLSHGYGPYVSPPATLKKVLAQSEAITNVKFRPSLYHQYRAQYEALTDLQKALFTAIEHKASSLNEVSDAQVLDALITYNNYRKKRNQGEFLSQKQSYYRELLVRRSQINEIPKEIVIPPPKPPHLSHGEHFISVAQGLTNQQGFTELSFRASFHDFLNLDTGQSLYSTVEFFRPKARYYPNKKIRSGLSLESLSLLNILSLFPYEDHDLTPSYGFSLSLDRDRFQDNQRLRPLSTIDTGASFFLIKHRLLAYGLIGPKIEWDNQLKRNHYLSFPLTLGLHLTYSHYKSLLIFKRFFHTQRVDHTEVRFEQSLILSQNHELRVLGFMTREKTLTQKPQYYESSLSWIVHF